MIRYGRNWVKWLWLLVFLGWMWTAAAGVQAREVHTQAGQKSCLWSVQGGSTTWYLLGSIHLLKPDVYPLAPAIEQAYRASRLLVFETDLAAMHDVVAQAKIAALGRYPEGQNLFQHISQSTRRLLEKKLVALGLAPEYFAPFRPWFVAINLEALEVLKMGFNPAYGVDVHFYNRAQNDAKETTFLETLEEQVGVFTEMSPEDQNAFLNQTLTELDVMEELTSELIRYWRNGNAPKLHTLLHESFQNHQTLYHRIMVERNQRWTERIEQLIKQHKNVMVVVGAGHLVGPDSVVEMLRRKGYQAIQH